MKNVNIIPHDPYITKRDREKLNKHKSFVLWFTGLSGSGKSTIASSVETILHNEKFITYVLDGDNIRHGVCSDLGFTSNDRKENIRRVGEISRLMYDAGIITIVAIISPIAKERERIKKLFNKGDFIEIYCNASLAKCESRDVKGLYKKARIGLIKNYTGIDSEYEIPSNPDLVLDTENNSIEECVNEVLNYLLPKLTIKT